MLLFRTTMENEAKSKYFTRSNKDENQSIPIRRKHIKIEEDSNEAEEKKIKLEEDPATLKPVWYPNNWQTLLENIKIMRSDKSAVVDSQGCERTADPEEIPSVNFKFSDISCCFFLH